MKADFESDIKNSKNDLESSFKEEDDSLSNNEKHEDQSQSSFDTVEGKYVADSKMPTKFLTRVGGLMMFNMMFVLYLANFIVWNIKDAKLWYRSMRLKNFFWAYFAICLILKLVAGFGYKIVKSLIGLIFLADCILSGISFFGFYWFFETRTASLYEYKGHWVVVIGCCLFATSFGYVFSTLIKMKDKKSYSVVAGVLIMSVFTCVVLFILKLAYPYADMLNWYFTIWTIFLFFHIYLAYNSVFFLRYRSDETTQKDTFYVFYRFNVDWFSRFWVDLISYIKDMKEEKKKEKIEKKRKRKKKKKSKYFKS